jgi:predicted aspartyl protease
MRISALLQIIDLNGDGFHPLLNIKVYGKTFTVVLDTGASKTAFDKGLLLKANKKALINDSDILSTGLGTNSMQSFTATIHDMRIGRLKIPEFQVAVLDLSTINIAYTQMGHPQVLGVLGGDILMKYQAIIDYGKQVIKFTV